MKILPFTSTPAFKSVREDRNTVSQLKRDNKYSLTEPNQRRIDTAIDNLGKESGEVNIEFLIDVGKKLAYQTHISSDLNPKRDWRLKLKNAAEASLAQSDPILAKKYQPQIDKVFADSKGLNSTERALLSYRDSILSRCDMDSLKNNPNKNVKNLEKNINYFIISSETSSKQKLYILKKLDYFMSDDYEINPQLVNKKTQVLAEMMNDIAVNTPGTDVPNIKAINQKSHGMCAAISIARKSMAYEDKANYVDSLLSELDASDNVMIYDRQNLGSGKRVPVKKVPIDFDYAQEKGYRIVDASTLQWMNIAQMYGSQNESLENFYPFDKNNFDAYHDSFFVKPIDDENIATKQAYYQSLMKAKDVVGNVKAKKIVDGLTDKENRKNHRDNIDLIQKYNQALQKNVSMFLDSLSSKEKQSLVTNLLSLSKSTSDDVNKSPENMRKYSFIPNEETSQKILKVKNYLKDSYQTKFNNEEFDKYADDVVEKIENIAFISKELGSTSTLVSKANFARKLYEAEAVYSAAILTGLADADILNDRMIEYDIPDAQTRLTNGINHVINKISKNDDKVFQKHFGEIFGTDSKDELVQNLTLLKKQTESIYTLGIDSVYASMGLGDRRTLLNNEIESQKDEIKNGNEDELLLASKCLKVKPDKNLVISKYDKIQRNMKDNPSDEKAYSVALASMGYNDSLEMLVEIYQTFADNMFEDSPYSKLLLENFNSANKIESGDVEKSKEKFAELGQIINMYVNNIELTESMFEVKNDDNSNYYSIVPANLIIKKMENEGRILPEKDMRRLQNRFTAIDKIKSQDEFSRRSGKISKPELYQFSKQEKIALKNIDNKLNSMYADVVRSFDRQYREIKPALAKHSRFIGTNSGHYWVTQEGESGLSTDREIKIFEQLTDRPYYSEENIEKAVDVIKNGEHSGVSGSSVFHNEIGMHAQYIADIDKGPNGKDILYHDNSWGASEQENTWVDSEGLTRTDYSDNRGGELGYITNSSYRNGNYVENLVNKTGHVEPEIVENRVYNRIKQDSDEDFDFALMRDIILTGNNPEYKDIAGSFKDAFFIPDSAQIDDFKKVVSKMTKEQIKKATFRVDSASGTYKKKFDRLEQKVKPSLFNKGIATQEDYNALADNDNIKLTFEKAAIRLAYPDASMYKMLPSVKTMDDIKNIRDQQREIARNYFDYSFGKAPEALTYVAFENGEDLYDILLNAFKDNKVRVRKDDFLKITKGFLVYDKGETDKFTGRVSDNIDFAVNKLLKQIDNNLEPSDKLDAAKAQIKEEMTEFLDYFLYFNSSDLNNTSPKAKAIRRWIDDKYNPKSDEDFVQIYRNLQDMTVDEFKVETADVSDADLGIRNISGFDVLKKFNISNDEATDEVRNVMFYDEFSSNFNSSKTSPAYKYRKLEKIHSGDYYQGERTFDDLYRTMKNSLSSLDYEKMFNKHADANFRKYNAIPAYPKLEMSKEQYVDDRKADIVNVVTDTTNMIASIKNTISGINLVNELNEYSRSIPSGRLLTDKERLTLNDMIGSFITANAGDSELKRSNEAAARMIELDENATIDDYKADIDIILGEFDAIQQINPMENLQKSLIDSEKGLQEYFNVLQNSSIPKKYHRIMSEDAKNWINAEKHAYNNDNPFTALQKLSKLKSKIFASSNGIDNKALREDLASLVSSISFAKMMNSMPEVQENVKADIIKEINDSVEKLAKTYVVPEKQNYVKSNIMEYIAKEMRNSKSKVDYDSEIAAAKEKFLDDYMKYHLINQPSEVLEGYMMANAKDADTKNSTANIYKAYLTQHLDLAKLIEIQENLMEAVSKGNAAEVKDYFDDYNIDFGYGDVSMASDRALDYMIRSILIDNNTDTAKMFVEKLGLGDRIVALEKDILDDIDKKKPVDDIVKLIKDTNYLVNVINSTGQNLIAKIDTVRNPIKEIDKAKQTIIKKTEKLGNNQSVKLALSTLDGLKPLISKNTGLLPSLFVDNYLNTLLPEISDQTNAEIADIQSDLSSYELLYSFLLDLNLPEYSKGYKMQQELQKSYEKFVGYYTKNMQTLSNLDGSVQITQK